MTIHASIIRAMTAIQGKSTATTTRGIVRYLRRNPTQLFPASHTKQPVRDHRVEALKAAINAMRKEGKFDEQLQIRSIP
jgi:hypothetical protein